MHGHIPGPPFGGQRQQGGIQRAADAVDDAGAVIEREAGGLFVDSVDRNRNIQPAFNRFEYRQEPRVFLG